MTLLLNHVSTGNMFLRNLTNFEQFHKSFFFSKKIHSLPFKYIYIYDVSDIDQSDFL